MSSEEEDRAEQEDELEALEVILEEAFTRLDVRLDGASTATAGAATSSAAASKGAKEGAKEDERLGGVIQISPEMTDPISVQAKTPSGKAITFKVQHLPPLELQFRFPANYPSVEPPSLSLRCTWLTQAQLRQVARLLDEEWESAQGTPVIFTFSEILKVCMCQLCHSPQSHAHRNAAWRSACPPISAARAACDIKV